MLLKLFAYLLVLVACAATSAHGGQAKPLSPPELALYQGKDREKILLDGAKKEGQVTFYRTHVR